MASENARSEFVTPEWLSSCCSDTPVEHGDGMRCAHCGADLRETRHA